MQNDISNIGSKQVGRQAVQAWSTRIDLLRQGTRWVALCATLTLTACASVGSSAPEEQVRLRANERWQALVAGEFTQAYSYNTSGFRAVVTPDGFRGRIGSAGSWVAAHVVEVNCPEAVKCLARVRIDFKPVLSRRFGAMVTTYADETWLLEDGKWWYFQRV